MQIHYLLLLLGESFPDFHVNLKKEEDIALTVNFNEGCLKTASTFFQFHDNGQSSLMNSKEFLCSNDFSQVNSEACLVFINIPQYFYYSSADSDNCSYVISEYLSD